MSMLKDACLREGISGEAVKAYVTNHCTRAAVVSALCRTAHSDSAVQLKTGHRTDAAIKRHHNLTGEEGKRQEKDIFGEESMTVKRVESLGDVDKTSEKSVGRDDPSESKKRGGDDIDRMHVNGNEDTTSTERVKRVKTEGSYGKESTVRKTDDNAIGNHLSSIISSIGFVNDIHINITIYITRGTY